MKRIFILISCVAVLMSVVTLSVFADSPDSGTVNSAALSYFTGVVNKLPQNSDYVIYRSGDYSATMIYGFNFNYNNNRLSSSDECIQLVYDSRGMGSTGYYFPTINQSTKTGFSLDVDSSSIIYSSLGSWSSVGDTSKDNISYILWSVVFLIFMFVIYKHFRNRRHYINL